VSVEGGKKFRNTFTTDVFASWECLQGSEYHSKMERKKNI
jgi:hypothetical protein